MANEPINISVLDYGAKGDNRTDDTKAIQAAIDAGFTIGATVSFPDGIFRVSQLVLHDGTVLQGVSSGTYPDNELISGSSVLARIARTNKHLLVAPDGSNYCRISDLSVDGNKVNNTSGYGLYIADGAVGQEAQLVIERSYIHDNPESNVYFGRNRRANSITNSVLNYSLKGDGITVAGSDNTIAGCIMGSNARAGICLGTTATQNWPASSPANSANICHVNDNNIYGNLVGIAIANGSAGCMISGNGIDRNRLQGITVYSGSSNSLVQNTLHSNGTAANKTYAHIDVGRGVAEVCIANNNFSPQDSGVINVASYCVYIAPGATRVIGNLGATDPTAAAAVTNAQPGTASGTAVSLTGGVVQGAGSDILTLKNNAGSVVVKVPDTGAVAVSGAPGAAAGARFVGGTTSGAPTSGSWLAGDFAIDHTGKIWIYNGTRWITGG
jgi:parallel beta-helix repeat protein